MAEDGLGAWVKFWDGGDALIKKMTIVKNEDEIDCYRCELKYTERLKRKYSLSDNDLDGETGCLKTMYLYPCHLCYQLDKDPSNNSWFFECTFKGTDGEIINAMLKQKNIIIESLNKEIAALNVSVARQHFSMKRFVENPEAELAAKTGILKTMMDRITGDDSKEKEGQDGQGSG